jgi:hypothetical protein
MSSVFRVFHEAAQQVQPNLGDPDDEIARATRETCEEIERQFRELTVPRAALRAPQSQK